MGHRTDVKGDVLDGGSEAAASAPLDCGSPHARVIAHDGLGSVAISSGRGLGAGSAAAFSACFCLD
ncbi:MAG: hypothetical protein JSU73_01530, partial [candidate division WOR-3 bacterium]